MAQATLRLWRSQPQNLRAVDLAFFLQSTPFCERKKPLTYQTSHHCLSFFFSFCSKDGKRCSTCGCENCGVWYICTAGHYRTDHRFRLLYASTGSGLGPPSGVTFFLPSLFFIQSMPKTKTRKIGGAFRSYSHICYIE